MSAETRPEHLSPRLPDIVNGHPNDPPMLFTVEHYDQNIIDSCLKEQFPDEAQEVDIIRFINNEHALENPKLKKGLQAFKFIALTQVYRPSHDSRVGFVVDVRADLIAKMCSNPDYFVNPSDQMHSAKLSLAGALQYGMFSINYFKGRQRTLRTRDQLWIAERFIDVQTSLKPLYPIEPWLDAFTLRI